LAVAQVSLAFVLLVGAGLMVASFREVLSVDPGFHPGQVLTASLSLPESRYPGDGEIQAFSARAREAVEALPGVRSAALTTLLPFSDDNNKSVVTVEGRELAPGESAPTSHNSWVTAGYFAAMGIPLLDGPYGRIKVHWLLAVVLKKQTLLQILPSIRSRLFSRLKV
jgi:hypothetical protein